MGEVRVGVKHGVIKRRNISVQYEYDLEVRSVVVRYVLNFGAVTNQTGVSTHARELATSGQTTTD